MGGKTTRALTVLARRCLHTQSLPFLKTHHCCRKFPSKIKSAVLHNCRGALVPAAMVAPSAGPCAEAGAPALPVSQPALAQSPGAENSQDRGSYLSYTEHWVWLGKREIGEEGRSEWVRLWGSWSRAWAHSPCDEHRRAVKSRGSSQWGALCLPQPCIALCCSRGEEEWGDTCFGLALAVRWAMAVHLPRAARPACVLNPKHPPWCSPKGLRAWLCFCPVFSHLVPLQLPPLLHPSQNYLAGLQSQTLRSWEMSSSALQCSS